LSDVALVTGGSRGIGAAIATRLAADGHPVAINYVVNLEAAKAAAAEIEGRGGECLIVQADVSIRTDVERMFDEVEDAFGSVGILVNNAGVRVDSLALSMTDEDFQRVISTNLFGTFACSRRALRSMLAARRGRIVNVSSVAGLRGSAGQTNYSAAKAGVIALTKSLAVEVGRKGITVNAVAPGIVATELTTTLPSERFDALVASVPVRRAGESEEVADAVSFLCSPTAAYVNGAVLVIDGGMTA
jgi:3-oxoacyl-[acyl-carrier protein] reductase